MPLRFDVSAFLVGSGVLAGSLLVQVPAADGQAQRPVVRSPAECLRFVDSAYERARAAAAKAHRKFEFSMAQSTEQKDARACAARSDVGKTESGSLLALAELYNRAAEESKAEAAAARYFALAPAEKKAQAGVEAVRTLIIPTTRGLSSTQLAAAERIAAKLDALGNAAGQERMQAYRLLALVAANHQGRLTFFDKAIDAIYSAAQAQAVPAKKAPLLSGAINMALMAWEDQPTAARSSRVDRYLQEMEALPDDAAAREKLATYAVAARTFAGDPRELPYINKTIALGRELQQDGKVSTVPFEVVMGYYMLATYHALRGGTTQVKDILTQVAGTLPDGGQLVQYWMQRLAMYGLIGKQAPDVAVDYWINGKAAEKSVPFRGKVTLLEFCMPTSHSPTPPEIQAMSDMLQHFDKKRFQIVVATKLVGYSCCGEHLSPEEEISSIRQFWLDDRKIPAKIAIIDPPSVRDDRHPVYGIKAPAAYEEAYRLRTMPTVVLVDESGTVRFVSSDFNPAQLTAKISEIMGAPAATGTH